MKSFIACKLLFLSLFFSVLSVMAIEPSAHAISLQTGPSREAISLSIYPNPATTHIIVKGEEIRDIDVSILNLLGQEVKKVRHVNDKDKIDVSDLKSGVYFFQVSKEVLIRFIKD